MRSIEKTESVEGSAPRLISVSSSAEKAEAASVSGYDLLERDFHSLLHTIADISFIIVLGLLMGVLFNAVYLHHPYFEAGHFWCAITISLLYIILDRARVRDNGIALTNRRSRVLDATKVWTMSFAGLIFVNFALRTNADLSRGFLALYYASGVLTLTMWRAFMPPMIARVARRFGPKRTDWVVVGDRGSASLREISEELRSNSTSLSTVISLDARCSEEQWPREQQMVLSIACRALRTASKGAIYLCSAGLTSQRLASLCYSLSILPVGTYIVPDAATAGLVGCKPILVGRHIALELRRAPMNSFEQTIKRVMDIVLGSVALVLLWPLLAAVAIAIRLDSRGPIFFRQNRTGKGGKPFRIYKFRSMYVTEDGPTIQQACRNDPRVTRIGRFLRASSIDELPQILNVLRGEMSLVGPRPHAVAHDKHYSKLVDNYEVRQHVKPGITGWAQVSGFRGETASVESMQRRIEHDVWYALNANLALDIEIIARTFIEVFRTRNAY